MDLGKFAGDALEFGARETESLSRERVGKTRHDGPERRARGWRLVKHHGHIVPGDQGPLGRVPQVTKKQVMTVRLFGEMKEKSSDPIVRNEIRARAVVVEYVQVFSYIFAP